MASKSRPTKKLLLIGGLHGYDPTGVPTGQKPAERAAKGSEILDVDVGGKSVSSFALEDLALKRFDLAIDFTYKNIGKWTTAGPDVSPQRLQERVELIRACDYSNNRYVLLTWCFSRFWAVSRGL